MIVFAAAGLTACGGSDSVRPVEVIRGTRVVAGANVTDTAAAVLLQALVVEVHDTTGAFVPTGTVVRFNSVIRTPTGVPETYLQALSSAFFDTFASSTTDASGRATVIVKFGFLAGTGRVTISVPILGTVDTVRYTITPASAARVVLAPADTLLYVGKSFTYRGGVTDQFGNSRTDAVTWKLSSAGVAVTPAGAVSASALGRYTIIGSTGVGADTAAVSVVPAGRLAGTTTNSSFQPAVGMMDIDGSNLKLLATASDGGIGINPAWMPSRSSIIYSTLVNGTQQLYVVDTNGVSRPFFANGIPNVTHQAEPRPSRDGQWVFFVAYDSRCSQYAYCLYRSRIDGSLPELLGTAATSSNSLRPSPSPDGSRVAFMGVVNGTSVIQVLDVATKSLSSWAAPGTNPAWSPDGTEIAFVSNAQALTIIHADGTSVRTIDTAGRLYGGWPMSWTSDGKYLLARPNVYTDTYDIIDVQTGTYLPLQYAVGLHTLSIAP
jgi:Tol biopolymer transport system component